MWRGQLCYALSVPQADTSDMDPSKAMRLIADQGAEQKTGEPRVGNAVWLAVNPQPRGSPMIALRN